MFQDPHPTTGPLSGSPGPNATETARRVQLAIDAVENCFQDTKAKTDARRAAQAALSNRHYGGQLLAAIEGNILRRENPSAPLLAAHRFLDDIPEEGAISSDQLVALGRVITDSYYRDNPDLSAKVNPFLQQLVSTRSPADTVAGFWLLTKTFHSELREYTNTEALESVKNIAAELAILTPSFDEAKWFITRARSLAANFGPAEVLAELDLTVDVLGFALDRPDTRTRARYSQILREDVNPASNTSIGPALQRLRALSPLLDRDDIDIATVRAFRELLNPQVLDDRGADDGLAVDRVPEVANFIYRVTAGSPSPSDIKFSLNFAQSVISSATTVLDSAFYENVAELSNFLRHLPQGEQGEVHQAASDLYRCLASQPDRLSLAGSLLSVTSRQSGRSDLVHLVAKALVLHQEDSVASFHAVTTFLSALTHPSAPPALARSYVDAIADPRFNSISASTALLKRLSLHASLYILPEANSAQELADLLTPIGTTLKQHPHVFLQEEPDAERYRQAQENFYPSVRGVYQRDPSRRASTEQARRPFHLLIPPLQRSLGGFMRVSDIHHGFGVHAIPSRRTPDGEAPLLVRFGLAHGTVSMLNTDDNKHFPGKGFALSRMDPKRLFPARPNDDRATTDPFVLYKQAWPSLSRSFERMYQAQFIFARGMVVIAGVDPEHYSIQRREMKLQYSLIVYNAHFENPFNEVAQLVPTAILHDFFRGTIASIDDYRGFNPTRANAKDRIPNPQIFKRHPTLGKYVINVGLPESILLGLAQEGSLEHNAWLGYRGDVIEYERNVRQLDKEFADRLLDSRRSQSSLLSRDSYFQAALALRNFQDSLGAPTKKPERFDMVRAHSDSLYGRESRLITERGELIKRLERLDSVSDPLERDSWQCVHRLVELYDLWRIGFAYYARGLTLPRGAGENEEADVELGEAEEAGFNQGSEMMLRELYRGHSLHELGNVTRDRFPILVVGETLHSSRFHDTPVMIDSFDMRGFVMGRPIQFSPGEITEEDIGVWQAGVLPHIQDGPGKIPELRLIERHMLPKPMLHKLEQLKGRSI